MHCIRSPKKPILSEHLWERITQTFFWSDLDNVNAISTVSIQQKENQASCFWLNWQEPVDSCFFFVNVFFPKPIWGKTSRLQNMPRCFVKIKKGITLARFWIHTAVV